MKSTAQESGDRDIFGGSRDDFFWRGGGGATTNGPEGRVW